MLLGSSGKADVLMRLPRSLINDFYSLGMEIQLLIFPPMLFVWVWGFFAFLSDHLLAIEESYAQLLLHHYFTKY